jgi:hypothetical protein
MRVGRQLPRHEVDHIEGVDVHRLTGRVGVPSRWFGPMVRRRSRLTDPVLLNCGVDRANWYFHEAFAAASSRTALVVHDIRHLEPGFSSERCSRLEAIRNRLVDQSDVIVGLSTGAIADIPGAHYVGHGCDDIWGTAGVDAAAEPADLRSIPHPRAVYLGALWKRISIEGVEALAEAGFQVVLVGFNPSVEFEHVIKTNPRVHFLGSRVPSETPAYLLHCDVGIVPHTNEPFTRSMEPHKLYNYSSAGLRSVALSCVVPARLEPWTTATSTVPDFVDATWAASSAGRLDRKQIEIARSFTWTRVAIEILTFVAAPAR